MTLDQRLENVGVLGAAGKMGSGIALLVAQEMAKLKIKNPKKDYHLYAMDISEKSLDGLLSYIRKMATKSAEKGCVMLRELYKDRSDLIENYDIIDQFTQDVMDVIRPVTDISALKDAHMIFEAIVEDEKVKFKVLDQINNLCSKQTFYFTNTSSIPIHVLDKEVGLEGRIIGMHFYNPPAVQKLVELIQSDNTKKEVADSALELGKRLRKKIVPSNDIAGFIGNGHFMRDILHAVGEVEGLKDDLSQVDAIYALNKVSQDYLIRPMGIFQLIDYVGVEVCQLIMKVMTKYIPDTTLQSSLIDSMVEKKVIGGQNPNGSQKDGILKYEKGRPAGIYDLKKGSYRLFGDGDWKEKVDKKLGNLPDGWAPWRALLRDPKKDDKLQTIFHNLKSLETLGADLAKKYFKRSKEIGEELVRQGVADNVEDVNKVMTNGFFHLYGPVNDYVV
ncbi:MAG: 3-hydroxyacyl-CoA dehydrogenase family protein [bacterium]